MRGRRRGQSGQSLMEVLIAVMLLATVFVALAGGLFTVVKVTDANEHIQMVDSALITYGEIIRAEVPYTPCQGNMSALAVAEQYQTAAENSINNATGLSQWQRPPYMLVSITQQIESWDLAARDFAPGCIIPDTGVQRISYQAIMRRPNTEHPDPNNPAHWDTKATGTGQVVKRKAGPS